jgi:hypothetical protein
MFNERGSEEMILLRKENMSLYVDHATQQLVVRDLEGSLWVVPSCPAAWEQRQPFEICENTKLESIPGHYKNLLQLPF